jgi:glutaredoxin-related protein
VSLFPEVVIFGYAYDGYFQRCISHMDCVGINGAKFLDLRKDSSKKEPYQPKIKTPQVYVNNEYIGGFEELVERFPL